MNVEGKRVLVVGFARTGEAVARFLASRGAQVMVTDKRMPGEFLDEMRQLRSLGVGFELGHHDLATFLSQDLIVVSPGVPMEIPPLETARSRGIEIISEIELGCRFVTAPILAITGTNGKTTTTSLAGEILTESGYETFVGGNIGTPLIQLVESGRRVERVVLELSSFQLEGVTSAHPRVAALLNITEDHLDRYRSFDEYIAAKERLFMNMGGNDVAVMNLDDPVVARIASRIPCRLLPFSHKQKLDEGVFVQEGEMVVRIDGREERFGIGEFRLKGLHNLENIMAALGSTLPLGGTPEAARRTLARFGGLPHRMELVRTVDGVGWYEDSKATNVGSVEKALASFSDITLIAGGKDKGGSYLPLAPLVRERVRHMILIGEARERIAAELGGLTDTHLVNTLKDAVDLAHRLTKPGGTVLFSPACSSFDMFRDYEDRARQFRALVERVPPGDQP